MEAREEGLSLSLGWSHFRGCRSFTMLFHLCPRLYFKGNGALNSECLSTSNRSSHSAKVRYRVKSPRPSALIYSRMEIGPLFSRGSKCISSLHLQFCSRFPPSSSLWLRSVFPPRSLCEPIFSLPLRLPGIPNPLTGSSGLARSRTRIFFSNFPAKNLASGRMCRSRSPQISLR